MTALLLVIIYMAFISLGLPDAVLGSAWPVLHKDLQVPVSSAGIMTMVISAGTIISSLFSVRLIRRFGTGKVTMVSVAMTAAGLIGITFSNHFIWLCLLGIPLGLGAGAVDSALNNFVALHFKATHMNWLHCFWGVGATAGPLLMSLFIIKENGWRIGYGTIGLMQAVLVACLFLSLPLWKKYDRIGMEQSSRMDTGLMEVLNLQGAKQAMTAFFCYCAVEAATGLWGSSFLVMSKGISAETAAKWVSLYYFGITAGRFFAGFLTLRFNNLTMIRAGQIVCLSGAVLLALPFSSIFQMTGLILIGLGCAPIFPAMLHETPNRFGAEMSQGMMGIQMASAYVGITVVPPLFGALAGYTGFQILPVFLVVFVAMMIITSEKVNKLAGVHNFEQ